MVGVVVGVLATVGVVVGEAPFALGDGVLGTVVGVGVWFAVLEVGLTFGTVVPPVVGVAPGVGVVALLPRCCAASANTVAPLPASSTSAVAPSSSVRREIPRLGGSGSFGSVEDW